jgi:hypothetical protein
MGLASTGGKNLPVRLVPVRPLDEAVVAFCVRQCLGVSAETEQGEVSLQAYDVVPMSVNDVLLELVAKWLQRPM